MVTKKVSVFENINHQWVISSNNYDIVIDNNKDMAIKVYKFQNKNYRLLFDYQ